MTMSTTVHEAVARGPQLTLDHDWEIITRGDTWWVVAATGSRSLPQTQVVAAGAAAQEAAIALEAEGHRVLLRAFPPEEPRALAAVTVLGPGPGHRAAALLAAARTAVEPPPHPLRPSDLTHLNLAAEAFGCELLWQNDVINEQLLPHAQRLHARPVTRPLSTVVTCDDQPESWLAAGQALAQCGLIAADLHCTVQLGPHALGRRATRQQVRDEWELSGWPQAQFIVQVRADDDECSLP
jgi:hypothetical protein